MPGSSSLSTPDPETELRDLPPSAKLVAKTLEYEGDLTQGEIADSSLLPARTVRHALTQLEENGIVTSRVSFMDARRRIYTLEADDADR